MRQENVEKITDALLNFPAPEISDGGPGKYYEKLEYYEDFMEFKQIILPPLYYLTSFFVYPLQDFNNHIKLSSSDIIGNLCKQDLTLLGVNIRQKVLSYPLRDVMRNGIPPEPKKEFLRLNLQFFLWQVKNMSNMPNHIVAQILFVSLVGKSSFS